MAHFLQPVPTISGASLSQMIVRSHDMYSPGVSKKTVQNIAPTLMIVRVGYGRSVGDTTTNPEPRVLSHVRSTAAASTPPASSSLVMDIGVAHYNEAGASISLTELGKEV